MKPVLATLRTFKDGANKPQLARTVGCTIATVRNHLEMAHTRRQAYIDRWEKTATKDRAVWMAGSLDHCPKPEKQGVKS